MILTNGSLDGLAQRFKPGVACAVIPAAPGPGARLEDDTVLVVGVVRLAPGPVDEGQVAAGVAIHEGALPGNVVGGQPDVLARGNCGCPAIESDRSK